MGLITKEVEITLHNKTIKYYENLGYKIPRVKGKWGKITVPYGTKIIVKTEDLPKNSGVKVDIECDGCNKEIKNISWQNYVKVFNKYRKYYCHNCAMKSFYNKTRKYKYNIGDVVLTKNDCKIQILEQITILNIRKSLIKGYKYKCLIDGNIDTINEVDLHSKKTGCNVCGGRKTLKGYNDLWTTHPEIAKLLKYPERGYEISFGKTKPEVFICPDCKYEKSININSLIRALNFPCFKCSDGISYPNKFAFNLLEQLKIVFIPEYSPDWIKPKRYDFYFELNNKKYILEMDGAFHKIDNHFNGQTKQDGKRKDKHKDNLAKENGIEVIRIDCVMSDFEYIKNNIINSRLNFLFDLVKIDWLKCHEYGCSSLVKNVCSLWNNGIKSTIDIGNKMKISQSTIIKYLKQGAKLGWCDYDPKEVRVKIAEKFGNIAKEKYSKPVIQLTLDNKFIKQWDSAIEIERELKIKGISKNISSCCNNKRKSVINYRWMFKDDYCNNINNLKPLKRYDSNTKKIVQLDLDNNFIKNWDSIREAERILNISNSHITPCCQGKRKTAGGYKWMYYEDYIKRQNKND